MAFTIISKDLNYQQDFSLVINANEVMPTQYFEPVDGEGKFARIYKETFQNQYAAMFRAEQLASESNFTIDFSIVNEQNKGVVYSTKDDTELKKYTSMTYESWGQVTYGFHEDCDSPTVYFDIDGTLGKWYKDMRGLSSYEELLNPQNHYFRDIEPHDAIISLAETLKERGYDVAIISAADKNTIRDKWYWLQEHLPFVDKSNICFCPIGANKSNFVKGNSDRSVLIDDYHVNLDEWSGIAIKCITTENSHQTKYAEIDLSEIETVLENANIHKDGQNLSEFMQTVLKWQKFMTIENPQMIQQESFETVLNKAVQTVEQAIQSLEKPLNRAAERQLTKEKSQNKGNVER